MEPLTIIVSFDIGKQLSCCCFPRGKTGLVDEFGFQHSKAAFDGRNFLFWIGCLDEFAAIGRGVLAGAPMITQCPPNNLPGAKIEHDRQVEPAFIRWHIGDKSEMPGVEWKTTIVSRAHSSHDSQCTCETPS